MNAHNPGNGRQTRVRWTAAEREQVADKAAEYLAHRPNEKKLEAIRHGINSLPKNRRRDASSMQAFVKEVPLIEDKLKEIHRRPGGLMGGGHGGREEQSLKLDTQDDQRGSATIGVSSSMSILMQYFVSEVSKGIGPEVIRELQGATKQEQAAIADRLRAIEAKLNRLDEVMDLIVREFGISTSNSNHQPAGSNSATPPAEESTEAAAEPSAVKKGRIRILVVGTRGRQPQQIRDHFSGADDVSLEFAKSGSRKALSGSSSMVVLWKNFIGHRDSDANPQGVLAVGGIHALKDKIQRVINSARKDQ